MQGSFQRVIDQFGQVQKAMGDVQAVTAQIGDLKRVFSNVKQRGAWGEMHLQGRFWKTSSRRAAGRPTASCGRAATSRWNSPW